MRTPSVWRPTLFLLLGVAALGACGQKGPLYLPAEAPATTTQPVAPTTDEKDDRKKDEKPPTDVRSPR